MVKEEDDEDVPLPESVESIAVVATTGEKEPSPGLTVVEDLAAAVKQEEEEPVRNNVQSAPEAVPERGRR